MKCSIRCKLIIIVIAIVVPLLLATVYSYFMMIEATKREISWKIRLVAEEITKDLGEHFEKTFNVIDALASHPAVQKMNIAECDRLFARLLPSYPLHLNILAAFPDGNNAGSAVNPQEAHKLNYNDKEWFQKSISGKRLVGDLHISKLFKTPAIMMAAPVYDDNASIKGVIGFPINLDKLRDKLVTDWKLPHQSIILVADGKGSLLVDTEHKEHVGTNISSLPLMQKARKAVNDYLKMSASDGIERLFYVTTPRNTDWLVIVGVPSVSLAKSALEINRQNLMVLIAATILGLILAIYIGHRFSNNIAQIVLGLNSIARGDLEHRLNLHGSDELVDIAKHFNEMAEKHRQYEREIRGMNAQLERQVEERTAELVAAINELDSFSYSVSHDLRAPLRSIDGFSKILLDDYGNKLDAEGNDSLMRIHVACIRMNTLIDDLLEFSHASRAGLQKENVNLSAMALNISEELQQTDSERQVEFQIAPDLYADVDPVLMRTVMENLLGNAWKFTQHTKNPVIMFGSSKTKGRTTYFFKDNGAGFNQDYVDKLFNVFQRLHTTQEFEGSGVGLASAKKIINRHGGEIWAEGKEGEGATFYFSL